MTHTDPMISTVAADHPPRTYVLYVGDLSRATGDQEFHAMVAPFGAIAHAKLVCHKHAQQSAGFGFVHMYSRAQALTTIRTLDGKLHNGLRLRLYLSREDLLGSSTKSQNQGERS